MNLQNNGQDRWQRAEELFLSAADLPADHRAAFLERECAGDAALLREVHSLLAFDQLPPTSITEALENAASELLVRGPEAGARFGSYRIIRQIGAGGMGAVYLAERNDDAFDKRVAIKVARQYVDASVRERLRVERQILAGLDHPYIARLVDGGTTEDGTPFFVLEYVEGIPIDKYCDAIGATVEQRCALFMKACEAVSYAHRNLVIHRDLKPGHILIDGEGTPKLLDFGLAKLLSVDPSSQEANPQTVAWVLTPEFASPEQARGEAATTAADIYSLGAVLYRLLTGVNPHRFESYSPSELEQVICLREPQRPSVAAANPAVGRRLRGDLDTIILTAMAKESDRRYRTVDQLTEDLRRHLAGLPVTAADPTLAYRAGKFLKRHRVWAAALSLAGLSLIGGTGVALWQAHVAVEARTVAEQEKTRAQTAQQLADRQRERAIGASARAEAEAHEADAQRTLADAQRKVAEQRLEQLVELANRSVFDIQVAIERLPGATEVRRSIAKTTLEFLDGLAKQAGDDPAVLRVLAQAYIKLGDVQGLPLRPNLGDLQGALASYRKSEAIHARLPANLDNRMRHVELTYRIGRVLLSTPQAAEAIPVLEGGLARASQLLREFPEQSNLISTIGAYQEALFGEYVQTDYAKATAYAEAELKSYQRLVVLRPDDDDASQSLASAYSNVGTMLALQGRYEDSLEYARRSIELRERILSHRPNDSLAQRSLMLAYGHLGDRLGNNMTANMGDPAAAQPYFEKAMSIAERMVAADPANQQAASDLANALLRLGVVMVGPANRETSLGALRRAEQVLDQLLAKNRNNRTLQSTIANVYEYIGRRLVAGGDSEQAFSYFEKALAIDQKQLADNPQFNSAQLQVLALQEAWASAYALQGDRAAALARLTQAGELIARLNSPNDKSGIYMRYMPRLQDWRGSVLQALARREGANAEERLADWKEARAAFDRSRELWSKADAAVQARFRYEIQKLPQKVRECDDQITRLEATVASRSVR